MEGVDDAQRETRLDSELVVLIFKLLVSATVALRAGVVEGDIERFGEGLLETVEDVESDGLVVTLALEVKLGEPEGDGDMLVDADGFVDSVHIVEPDGDAVGLIEKTRDSVALSDVVEQ